MADSFEFAFDDVETPDWRAVVARLANAGALIVDEGEDVEDSPLCVHLSHPDTGLWITVNRRRTPCRNATVRMSWGLTPEELSNMLHAALVLAESMGCVVRVPAPYLDGVLVEADIKRVVVVHQQSARMLRSLLGFSKQGSQGAQST